MNCTKYLFASTLLAVTFSFAAPRLRAQDPPQDQQQPPSQDDQLPDKPKPAARSFPSPTILYGNGQDDTNPNTSGLQSDYTPLTGVQNATLGIPDPEHSYWVPGLQYGANILSPGSNGGGSGSWYVDNYFAGNVTLLDSWSRSQLALNYSGGAFVSSDSTQGTSQYQTFSFSENYHTGRYMFQVLDQFSYLPQSSFGFGGGTNLGVPGVGGSLGYTTPGLGTNYVPNQSISGFGPRYSNASALQLTYALSKRGSITLSGVYGLLTFINPGNFDSTTLSAGAGYNYAITRKDTLGVVYRFTNDQFPGNPQAYGDHTVNIAYGRKITGRLAVQLLVGPEYTTFRIPIGTSSSTTGVSVSAFATYGFEKGSITGGYNHGLSNGSGLLTGSVLDQFSFRASRRLTRAWSVDFSAGYGHNRPVINTGPNSGTYDSTYITVTGSRPFGRNLNLGLGYTDSINSSSNSGCVGSACSYANYNYQMISLSIQWHTRPFLIPSF
jgi:hypothetical protein